MAKIKLTKGELKRQRDALKQFERYLPTLILKKQQLQLEIHHQRVVLKDKRHGEAAKGKEVEEWAGLLAEPNVNIHQWAEPKEVITDTKNVAGVDVPIFNHVEFNPAEYDLFIFPLWVDAAIDKLRELTSMREEIKVLEEGIRILSHELRITTQRVNLFEKVKVPAAKEAIRLIKIYIGDQMANAVGRSKIAKKKIESFVLQGIAV